MAATIQMVGGAEDALDGEIVGAAWHYGGVQHDLARVGPFGFQDLAAGLAVAEFGAQVQILGPGRDGGRDMFCKGAIVWAGTDGNPGEVWDGYTVFQAKHKLRLEADPAANAAWLWTQVRAELNAWADPESGRDPVPNYLVIVTNVPLTPTPGSGGFDLLNTNIKSYIDALADDTRDVDSGAERVEKLRRMRRLRKWRIGDGNQVDGLLTKHQGVRRAFGAFLTVPDVFAHLADLPTNYPCTSWRAGCTATPETSTQSLPKLVPRTIARRKPLPANAYPQPVESVARSLQVAYQTQPAARRWSQASSGTDSPAASEIAVSRAAFTSPCTTARLTPMPLAISRSDSPSAWRAG
ncbi:hypothetical protein IU483_30290 [Streptomyces gardneri]|nr:hypothetical protein [Streptomyces gardneri]